MCEGTYLARNDSEMPKGKMAKDIGRRTGGPLLDLDSMILGLLILGGKVGGENQCLYS